MIAGALRTPSRHPLLVAGRMLLLLAILAPALGPLKAMAGHFSTVPPPVVVAVAATLAWAALRAIGGRAT